MTMAAMTTDGWIKIGVCWGFIAIVVAIMVATFLIDRKMATIDRKKNLKSEEAMTTASEQLESPEARDRRMKELYEKVWGPERKREELERKMKEVDR
jgi:hypothetical protein